MQALYLQSIKSPLTTSTLNKYKHKPRHRTAAVVDVYSQRVDSDSDDNDDYEEDSFCVGDDDCDDDYEFHGNHTCYLTRSYVLHIFL